MFIRLATGVNATKYFWLKSRFPEKLKNGKLFVLILLRAQKCANVTILCKSMI